MNDLIQFINAEIEIHGTLAAVSELYGVPRQTLGDIRSGKCAEPKAETLAKLGFEWEAAK